MDKQLRANLRVISIISGIGVVLVLIAAFLHALGPDVTTRHRQRMLFLHGMQSRYQGTSPAEIEAAARKYAQARGYDLEILSISGDDAAKQEAAARARIEKAGIDAVYTASRLAATRPTGFRSSSRI